MEVSEQLLTELLLLQNVQRCTSSQQSAQRCMRSRAGRRDAGPVRASASQQHQCDCGDLPTATAMRRKKGRGVGSGLPPRPEGQGCVLCANRRCVEEEVDALSVCYHSCGMRVLACEGTGLAAAGTGGVQVGASQALSLTTPSAWSLHICTQTTCSRHGLRSCSNDFAGAPTLTTSTGAPAGVKQALRGAHRVIEVHEAGPGAPPQTNTMTAGQS